MYTWLTDALQGASTVITANRRLSRVLKREFARQQVQADRVAWESPAIFSWQDWLAQQLQNAARQAELPTRLNSHQSQLLWERCLLKEVGESQSGISSLVRLARDAWQRMADWQVNIRTVARSAHSTDHRLFAAVAGRYLAILEHESWVDDAGLAQLVLQLLESGRVRCDGRITFVGFDRARPIVQSIRQALSESGCDVREAPARVSANAVRLQGFDSVEAEFRAAGAWARARLEESPGQSIAIIAQSLEQNAERITHLVREGLVPGWQYAGVPLARAVNTSYGRRLADYPAISQALLLLSWLVRDLSTRDLGHLLRSPMFGNGVSGGRTRLELTLRQMPERNWSPAMITAALRGAESGADATDWLGMVSKLTKARRAMKRSASPAEWAIYVDNFLSDCGWPGPETLTSYDFQLINRWRDMLNDLARLAFVSPSMSLKTAIRRLELMTTDTIFQPESEGGAVQLMGPLEASGAEFDAVWISGVTAAKWPPPGNPSPLLARALQREVSMPDAEPSDTLAYAQSLLGNLGNAADKVVCSYPKYEDDAEQAPSGLLTTLDVQEQGAQADPGWHAAGLSGRLETILANESAPGIRHGENIAGGAGAVQRQIADPLSAFIAARLGVSVLYTQAVGLPPALRGTLIHDALHRLYVNTPMQREIAAWSQEQTRHRIDAALNAAFGRHVRNTDAGLEQLMRLERNRVGRLLRDFVAVDVAREDFAIAAVEHKATFSESDVCLQLRIDRIDRLNDGTLAILDYKTGARRNFLDVNGRPKEFQLVVYAMALDDTVSAVALVSVDSREICFSGAGRGYDTKDDWHAALDSWKDVVRNACHDMSTGDVRLNAMQGVKDARPFNLLSRYTELLRGA